MNRDPIDERNLSLDVSPCRYRLGVQHEFRGYTITYLTSTYDLAGTQVKYAYEKVSVSTIIIGIQC